MSALVYNGLTSAEVGLIGLGVFLISLSVLDIAFWFVDRLSASLLPSMARAARVRSALAVEDEQQE